MLKTITVDNGSEFADFAQCKSWGSKVSFDPYTSWEQTQNKRHNGLFPAFVSAGASVKNCSAGYIPSADEQGARPGKKPEYATPNESFDLFLDRV